MASVFHPESHRPRTPFNCMTIFYIRFCRWFLHWLDFNSNFANALVPLPRAHREASGGPLRCQQLASELKAAARLNVTQDRRYAPVKFAGNLGAPFVSQWKVRRQ